MNPFSLLFLSIEVARIVARENDKTRVYFAYIPKMNVATDNPKISQSKIDFLEVIRSLHINPKLSIQAPPPNAIWDPESTNSSKHISIISETPTHYTIMVPSHFDKLNPLSNSSHDLKILELDKIPPYAQFI